jgi:hypothetical protein
MQLTLPILVQPKKKIVQPKPTTDDPNNLQTVTTSQPSQQELINQQQLSIFKSMLGEG